MLNNFIYAKKKALFLKALNSNEVPNEAIVFIEDTKEIWNHGTYFDCSTISDLEVIRQGAAKGATSVQPSQLANVATTGSYNDLTNKPTIPAIITESTVSGWGFTKNTYVDNKVATKQDKLVSGTNIKTINGESIIGEGDINTSSKIFLDLMECSKLSFFCVESVDIIVNGVSHTFAANSYVDLTIKQDDEFEIVPTSNKSIKMLTAYPGAIDTFYDWLEGVDSFANIVFDMNSQDMYVKWNQGHQGQYHVQFAQYINCIFWSDLAYVADISIRTNYTLYNSAQLPLCYSTIPKNTFKSFYCAYGVNSDPNWANPVYKESFALATHATQVFSYYGLHSIGVFDMDADYFNITLPKDCRGLMYGAGNILNAGIFDAINVTNFGAKSGSWRDAFGYCYMLKNLYIKNLKVNLNVSWSPINQESLNFILSNAANTSKITIYLSPYTYYALTDENKTIASDKNITLSLINTNYSEDNRLSKIDIFGDGTKFLSDDGTYKEISGGGSDYATKEELNSKQDTITDLEVIRQGAAKGATSVQQGTLSTVATSGSYNDLTDKPTIPNDVSESTVSDWGFAKSSALQTKAEDSSVVHKTGNETITGAKTFNSGVNFLGSGDSNAVTLSTNTRINVNGTNKTVLGFGSGTFYINHGDYSLLLRGKDTRPTYNSTTLALSSDVNGKQDKLVSGSNIKTINGTSILGSGDIVISSGGDSSSGNGAYVEVNHGTSDTTFTLTPNTFHVWDKVSSLTLTLGTELSGVANEYLFQFTSGSEPTTLILPDSIKFNSDFTVEENNIYQISILNGLGTVMSWENNLIKLITFTVEGFKYQAEEGMIWEEWVNSEYNTDGFYISENATYKGDMYIYNNGEPSKVIVNNGIYTLYQNHGGGAAN